MPNDVVPVAGSVNHSAFQTSYARMNEEQQREVQEVAVDVLEDQRKRVLAPVDLRGSPTAQDGGSAQNAL